MGALDVRGEFQAELPDGYRFDARDLALLATAQRIADRIDALEAELEATGLTVTGSTGQFKVSPLVAEIRLQQTALARVLDGVHIPSGDGGERKSPRHQRAATTRWERQRG